MKFKKEAERLFSKLEKKEAEGKIEYYKKRQVYPIFHEDGSINWFNLLTGGSYWKLLMAIAFVCIVLGVGYEYKANLAVCADLMYDYNLNITKNHLNPNVPEMVRLVPNATKVFEQINDIPLGVKQ